MASKKKIDTKRDVSQERVDGARKRIHLAEAFPVKGGDFLPIRQQGWLSGDVFKQTKRLHGKA